jgi:hypothetical protein
MTCYYEGHNSRVLFFFSLPPCPVTLQGIKSVQQIGPALKWKQLLINYPIGNSENERSCLAAVFFHFYILSERVSKEPQNDTNVKSLKMIPKSKLCAGNSSYKITYKVEKNEWNTSVYGVDDPYPIHVPKLPASAWSCFLPCLPELSAVFQLSKL